MLDHRSPVNERIDKRGRRSCTSRKTNQHPTNQNRELWTMAVRSKAMEEKARKKKKTTCRLIKLHFNKYSFKYDVVNLPCLFSLPLPSQIHVFCGTEGPAQRSSTTSTPGFKKSFIVFKAYVIRTSLRVIQAIRTKKKKKNIPGQMEFVIHQHSSGSSCNV